MAELCFEVPGRPVPQERPYFAQGRAFDRPQSHAKKMEIGLLAKLAMKRSSWHYPSEMPISVTLRFSGAHGGADIDNLMKLVCDALTGIVYRDDRQIVEAHIYKMPAKKEIKYTCTDIIVEEV